MIKILRGKDSSTILTTINEVVRYMLHKDQSIKSNKSTLDKPTTRPLGHTKSAIQKHASKRQTNRAATMPCTDALVMDLPQSQALQNATDKITQARATLTTKAAATFIQSCTHQKTAAQARGTLDFLQQYLWYKQQKLSTNPKFRWFKLGVKSRKKMVMLENIIKSVREKFQKNMDSCKHKRTT